MSLKDIIVVSGKSGLYKYVSQGRNNIIIESLVDHRRTTVPATANISMLDDIVILTEHDDVSLREVFRKIQMKENDSPAVPSESSDQELKIYFETILPEYNKERVYPSVIRKVIIWYQQLLNSGITSFDAPADEAGETVDTGVAGVDASADEAGKTENEHVDAGSDKESN